MDNKLVRILIALALVLLALISILFVAPWASSTETHQRGIASINDKVDTVLRLTATSTLASAGISAIPGDTATPIAEKLADFTEYFLLILCVLYSEKYLLTIIGAGVFRYLVPAVCGVAIASLFCRKEKLRALALKLAVFSLAFYLIIPASIRVSDVIYDSYEASINATITQAEELTDETAELNGAEDAGLIQAILQRLSETTETLTNKAAGTLNRFVETLAVMIVTACVIPILVLLFFLWGIKQITGVEISPPRPRRHRKSAESA